MSNIDPLCEQRCAYGTCRGGDDPCGGCCGCLGPCIVAYERTVPIATPTEDAP